MTLPNTMYEDIGFLSLLAIAERSLINIDSIENLRGHISDIFHCKITIQWNHHILIWEMKIHDIGSSLHFNGDYKIQRREKLKWKNI